jgi:hypothetical protein
VRLSPPLARWPVNAPASREPLRAPYSITGYTALQARKPENSGH